MGSRWASSASLTGGFSGERSDWRHGLRGPEVALVVELTAGTHVL